MSVGLTLAVTEQVVEQRLRWGRGAAAAVIVFDITNSESLTKAKAWVKELQRQGSPNMIMALAGNKADLGEARAVTADEAQVATSYSSRRSTCMTTHTC